MHLLANCLITKKQFIFFIKIVPFSIAIWFSSPIVNAQEYQTFETYKSQIIGGVNFNTNGGLIGGAMVRYNRHIKRNQYHYFGLEIINVKHPKEVLSIIPSTGNIFTPYKANAFIPVRLQYGREFLLFEPAEEEGIQINLVLAGGLTFGVLKPYMIEYDYGGISKIEPFDPDVANGIIGKGPLLSGFDRAKIIPGANIKAGLSLEFAQFRSNVSGIEVGFLLESFTSKIEMMKLSKLSDEQPQSFSSFSSVYLNIFFGFRN